MTYICENCRTANEPDAKRCIACGKPFLSPKKIKHKKITRITLFSLLAVFVLGFFGLFVLGNNMNTPGKTLESYFGLIAKGDYAAAMSYFAPTDDPLNTPEVFGNYCKSTYGEDVSVVSIKRAKKKCAEDERVYTVELASGFSSNFVVKEDGKTLLIYNKWKMKEPENLYSKTVTVFAPSDVVITVNGSPISESYKTTDTVVPGYEGLKDASLVPTMVSYKIDHLIAAPKVEGTRNGASCDTFTDGDSVLFSLPIDGATRKSNETTAFAVAKAYANYITNDARLGTIGQYLLKDSEVYANLKNFYSGWFTDHKTPVISNITYYDMCVYSDNHFTCGVKFDYFVDSVYEDTTFPIDYKIYFVKTGGKWYAADVRPVATISKKDK